jgi:hypothetical protein
MVTTYDLFREDLGRTLADPERMAGFEHDGIAPLEDAIGELSGWYGFSDAAERDRARRIAREVAGIEPRAPQLPAVNPFKGVGRNDPLMSAVNASAVCRPPLGLSGKSDARAWVGAGPEGRR